MLFNLFTTSSPANVAAATTTRAESQSQRASPPLAQISKTSKLRGIFQTLRRLVAPRQDANHCHPQGESNNIPSSATSSETSSPIASTLNPSQLTPPPSITASWVSYKPESPPIDRLYADTRSDSGRSWSSSWFEFERITARSEPQREGSAWQGRSDVSETEDTCSEESGEGNRRSWSSSWYEFERIPAESDPQRAGSAWGAPSDGSEGEATYSDSESGEHSRASTDASAPFPWSNEGLAWVNSGSSSPSPSPSAGSLRRMLRGRQEGRMYAMRVPSAYGSDTDEDDFMDYLLR